MLEVLSVPILIIVVAAIMLFTSSVKSSASTNAVSCFGSDV